MVKSLTNLLDKIDQTNFAKILDENAILCVTNLKGEFVHISPTLYTLLGYGLDEDSNDIRVLKPKPPLEQTFKDWLGALKKKGHWVGPIEFSRKCGAPQSLICAISHVINRGKGPSHFFWFLNQQPLNYQDYLDHDVSYKSFFKVSPVPKALFSLDTLEYIDVNSAWETYTGYNKESVTHHNLEIFEIHKFIDLGLIKTFQSSKSVTQTIDKARLFVKSDKKKYVNLHFEKIDIYGKAFMLEIINDISDSLNYQKQLQKTSTKSVQKKDAILELVNLIGKDFDEILKEVTSVSAKVMDVKRVSLWEFDKIESKIRCLNAYDLNLDEFKNDTVLYKADFPNYFKDLYSHGSVRVNDVSKSKLTKEFIEEYLKPIGISSLLDVFISLADDGLFGVLCFEHIGEPRVWTDEDEEFATVIASITSLAVENLERKRVEKKLVLEKDFSDELINSLQEGLSIVNPVGESMRVNTALCKMTGFSEKELVGSKPPFKYWPPENHDGMLTSLIDLLEKKTSDNRLTLIRKNGERFPVAMAVSKVKNKEGEIIAYFSTIVDITERIKKEKSLKQRLKISQKRKEVTSKFVSMIGQDYLSTIREIAQLSSEVLEVDQVSIWRFQNDETELVSKIFYNAKTDILDERSVTVYRTDFPDYFESLKDKTIVNACHLNEHSITREFADPNKNHGTVKSRLNAIIHGKNMRHGLISFEGYSADRTFSDEEENFAVSVANIISLMVESRDRITAENMLIRSNEKLLALNSELNKLKKELEQENSYLREEIGLTFNYEEMVYGSKLFSDVLTDIERVASTNATVLLLGESGTGKELLARAVHNISARKNKPLIKVNCAAIPRELIESELFGHKKGSFTGAINDKLGKFQLADGGTLFLDEIGELPMEMQPKLLRAIQESEIEQIGGTKTQKVDIRIIAATNQDLQKEIKAKNFREDLYFRLNVFPITVPPLRERIEDIPILLEHFVDKYGKLYNKSIKYISDETKTNLQSYSWPGNIRELQNLVERAVILCDDERLIIPNFKSSKKESLIASTVLSLDDVQRMHIEKVLKKTHWKIDGANGAAELLQIKPSTLRDRMTKLDIKKPK